jgi:hypothetical protein
LIFRVESTRQSLMSDLSTHSWKFLERADTTPSNRLDAPVSTSMGSDGSIRELNRGQGLSTDYSGHCLC